MLKHVDLFAGIGGFTQGLKGIAETVAANEIDDDMAHVYAKNHPKVPTLIGDIKNIPVESIPAHDILTGGFPCQPFSVGGKRQSFYDDRGNLFWEIVRIAKHHKPQFIILENVKGLLNMNNGRDLQFIKDNFSDLDYHVTHIIENAAYHGVPQHRERLFILCSKEKIDILQPTPPIKDTTICVKDILLPKVPDHLYLHDVMIKRGYKYIENAHFINTPSGLLNQIGYYSREGGKSSKANRVYHPLGVAPTQIVAWGGSCGAQTGMFKVDKNDVKSIRKLHVEESKRVMGFPEDYFIESEEKLKRKAYQQTGNSVVPQVVRAVAKALIK